MERQKHLLIALVIAGLSGCSWYVTEDDIVEAADRDKDGYPSIFAGGTDCDDADAAVFPGAAEICGDSIDNDCDGNIDNVGEGEITWYEDGDGDGFGGGGPTRQACPDALTDQGWSIRGGDCDDTNPAWNPSVEDADCDGIDENCDGTADEESEFSTWYRDADGDGFGDPSTGDVVACEPQLDRVSNGDDCDDGDPAISPIQPDDSCDEVDNDCDGVPDDEAPWSTWYPDVDGDGYGDAAYPIASCEAIGGHILSGGDCNDADPDIRPSAPELCDGIDNDCDTIADDAAEATLDGTNYTVNDAVAASSLGDVIDVCPGSWTVNTITVGAGENLTLQSVGGRGVTTLTEASGGSIASVTDDGVLSLVGFTLTGSATDALTIEDQATLSVSDSLIDGNLGSGIYAFGSSEGAFVYVDGTDFTNNDAGAGDGGGIHMENVFELTLSNSTISGNSATNGGGLSLAPRFGDGLAFIDNVLIDNNTATASGGGILAAIGFGAVWVLDLTNSTISNNTAAEGGGVYNLGYPMTGGHTTSIQDNIASSAGGGVALEAGSLADLSVTNNDAPLGGGIAVLNDVGTDGVEEQLSGLTIQNNTAALGAGLSIADGKPVVLYADCSVAANTATVSGGGAYLEGDAELVSTGVMSGNLPDDAYAGSQSYWFTSTDDVSCDETGCSVL